MLGNLLDERPVQETGDLLEFGGVIGDLEPNWRPTVHGGRIIDLYARAKGRGRRRVGPLTLNFKLPCALCPLPFALHPGDRIRRRRSPHVPPNFPLPCHFSSSWLPPGQAQQRTALADLKTTPEATGYKSTSTYDDVVKFMKAVDEASPLVFYTTYGKTYEGRDMPMAVVGTGLKDASPASVRATGRLRVHIQGNIHAGEVEGKEAAQVLLRELALGQHADWLRSMVFLITPIFNADGNEKFALTNRQRQNGPINGMGTRQQGQNLNINRDFMKLDTPEGRAFVKLWNDYDPQVGYDLHTSDGSCSRVLPDVRAARSIRRRTPAIMNADEGRVVSVRDETDQGQARLGHVLLRQHRRRAGTGRRRAPAAAARRGAAGAGAAGAGAAGAGAAGAGACRRGGRRCGGGRGAAGAAARRRRRWSAGGGTPRPCAPPETPTPGGAHAAVAGAPTPNDPMRSWNSFEALPRYHNSYVGLRNRFALLSEAYAYATFEDRIKVDELLHGRVAELRDAERGQAEEDRGRRRPRSRSSARSSPRARRSRPRARPTILMGEVEDEVNPVNGACMNRRKDVLKAETMSNGLWFAATATEPVPAEYYIPAGATKAIELLRAHGVQLRAGDAAGQRASSDSRSRPTRSARPTDQHRHRRARPAHADRRLGSRGRTSPFRPAASPSR